MNDQQKMLSVFAFFFHVPPLFSNVLLLCQDKLRWTRALLKQQMAVCTSTREQFIAKQHEVEFTVELYLKLLEKGESFHMLWRITGKQWFDVCQHINRRWTMIYNSIIRIKLIIVVVIVTGCWLFIEMTKQKLLIF